MIKQKKGDSIVFRHHDGDFKWFQLVGTITSLTRGYVNVTESTGKYGKMQVENCLIIASKDDKENEEEQEEEFAE